MLKGGVFEENFYVFLKFCALIIGWIEKIAIFAAENQITYY
jgi:hypothetical protein